MCKTARSLFCLTASLSIIVTGCSPNTKVYKDIPSIKSVQAQENNSASKNIAYNNQWAISHIKGNEAWDILNQRKEIKVAVVDTGVDYTHPDLKGRVAKDLGYNFLNNSKDIMDDNWHGTHVAGIIAADADNNIGISGIVGKAKVKIIPVKVLDKDGQGPSDIIAKGIKYSADIGADIINFSVGFDVKDKFIGEAITYAKNKGSFVVVSSGNNDINCDNSSPASDDGAYTVSSVNNEDVKSVFSNFGSSIKISAPGEEILSTVPGGEYAYRNGTSMAAPYVAGVAAMVKAANPELTPDEIEDILDKTAVDIMEKGRDQDTGFGLIDAYSAVYMAPMHSTEDNN